MEWLNSETIVQAGGIVVALVALFTVMFIVKKFAKIMGNHIVHQEKMHEMDMKSRDEHTKKFTELVEMIKNYFK